MAELYQGQQGPMKRTDLCRYPVVGPGEWRPIPCGFRVTGGFCPLHGAQDREPTAREAYDQDPWGDVWPHNPTERGTDHE